MKMKMLIEPLERRTLLSGGKIDTAFGVGGVSPAVSAFSEDFSKVAAGPNGTVYAVSRVNQKLLVARYGPDGQLDSTFNGSGYAVYQSDVPPADFRGVAVPGGVAVDASGGVYVATIQTSSDNASSHPLIVHYLAGGTLDPNWGTGGAVTTPWETGTTHTEIGWLGLDTNGNLLAAGNDDSADVLAVRFLADGSFDPAFGSGGVATLPAHNLNGSFVDVVDAALTPAGGVVMFGQTSGQSMVGRFTPAGTADQSFGTDGAELVPTYANVGWITAASVAVDASGRILLGGNIGSAGVERLLSNGAFDTTFGQYGAYRIGTYTDVTAMTLLGNGGIVLAASTGDANPATVVGLTPWGTPDITFGSNGKTSVPGLYKDIIQQPDGRIVLAGRNTNLSSDTDYPAVARLLAPGPDGAITGVTFNDYNGNGVNDDGSAPIADVAGAFVYLDLNHNAVRDSGEPTVQTDSTDGTYHFDDLFPIAYDVRVETAGYNLLQTAPAANGPAVTTVTGGQTTAAAPIGLQPTLTASGYLFSDTNSDGIFGASEPGIAGRTVFVDANNNGLLDTGEVSTATGSFGYYGLKLPTDATYRIRQVVPAGYRQTGYTAAADAVSIRNAFSTRFNFGSLALASVNVTVTVIGAATPTVGTNLVYIDANNNGVYDTGELSQAVNNNATATFQLAPGSYTLRLVPRAGFVQTYPVPIQNGIVIQVGATTTTLSAMFNVAPANTGTITGYLYNDANANGVQDTGESDYTGYGITAYLDANNDGVYNSGEPSAYTGGSGVFGFKSVPAGTYTLRLSGLSAAGVVATSFAAGQTVTVMTGSTTYVPGFGVSPAVRITVAAFDDANGDGVYAAPEDFVLTGRTVYADLNNNGTPDAGEPRTTTTGFLTLTAGTYTLRQVLPANWRETGRYATLTVSGETFNADGRVRIPTDTAFSTPPTFYFGSRPVGFFEINAFLDANGNGTQDTGEAGTDDGGFVYADLNNDGVFDGSDVAGAPSGVRGNTTIQLVPGTYTLRQSLASGWAQTSPAANAGQTLTIATGTDGILVNFGRWQPPVVTGASASGVVYSDANRNGKQDTGEAGLAGLTVYVDANNNLQLDAGERSTVTAANGTYALTGLTNSGTATRLRVIVPGGGTQITPTGGKGYSLTLTAGASNTGKSFGLYTPSALTASLSGFAFDDTNKNGLYDPTETKTSGKVIFLDTNNNGTLDTGEKSVTTGSNGVWSFIGLAAGTYHVRRVFNTGYTYSTAKLDVTLTAGQTKTGLAVGTKKA